jgi:glutathione S-transferase
MLPILYACPHACSLVSHIALEMAGEKFIYAHVDLFSNAHRAPEYLALNPRGRVPLLATEDMLLAETPTILSWLAHRHPHAGILPKCLAGNKHGIIADLSWFSSGIHPALTRVMAPTRFVTGESCIASIRDFARSALAAEFLLVDRLLSGRSWWLDERSGLDAYLFWMWARAGEGPIDLRPYSNWARHTLRMLETPDVQRAIAREREINPCFENIHQSAT